MRTFKKIFLVMLTAIIGLALIACEPNVAIEAPVFNPMTATFDKDNPSNVVVGLNLKGQTLTSLKLDDEAIVSSNFTVGNSQLLLQQSYLETLDNDVYEVVATTAGGSATLTLTITSADAPSLLPVTASFDKNTPANVVVTVDLKGIALQSITINNNALPSSAFTLTLNQLSLHSSYLLTQEEGVYSIVVSTLRGAAVLTLTISDSSGGDPVFVRPNYDVDFYDNVDFHDYEDHETTIEGQWPGYGIGDPFIMRFDGMYYLYVSTLDTENGVRAWKSPDLINWQQAQAEGLPLGYVVDPEDYTSRAAYAPEVYYWNGTFYMYMSPAGNGHYIYTSDSPEGPFVKVTDNLGMSIDGSVFIDDDEQMYFTRANSGGIRIHQMTDMLNINAGSLILDNTNIGGWTEGSYILKRDGQYYITYTGLHVASNGYRISYSTAEAGGALYDRAAFTNGINLPTLLETGNPDFQGLGHSATVLGPDMDSYYLVYHNLNNSGGPNRSLNIDRLVFNGKAMEVMAKPENSVVPKLPKFFDYGAEDTTKFDFGTGSILSKVQSGSVFSAEFNYRGADLMRVVVDYKDANNYLYVEAELSNNLMTLHEVKNGIDTLVASGTLVNDFNPNALHTIRVAQSENLVSVYFDGLKKITDAEVTTIGGKIGYMYSGDVEFGYTALSDVAYGLSDKLEVKQDDRRVFANLFTDEYSDNPTVEAVTTGLYDGTSKVSLNSQGNQATYLVNFDQTGFYGIALTYPTSDGGKKIGIQVDGGDVMMVTLPVVNTTDPWVKALVTEFSVTTGINQISLENVGSAFSYVSFEFIESSQFTPQFSHDLQSYVTTGADYKTIWKLAGSDGHRATAGTRQLIYIGDETITDFTLEVTIKFIGSTGTSTAGIVFRAQNDSFSQYDNFTSIQGYYLALNNSELRLEKLNYASERLGLIAGTQGANPSGTEITIKIVARGNTFTIYRNDELMLTVVDSNPFLSGHLGFYTNGAEVTYKNLVITP